MYFAKFFAAAILQNTYGPLLLPGLALLECQKLISDLCYVYVFRYSSEQATLNMRSLNYSLVSNKQRRPDNQILFNQIRIIYSFMKEVPII